EVELNVYSITGQLVKKLYRQEQLPGTYQIHWNGKNSRGQNLRGIYFIKGRIGVHPITVKVIRI
ncbi:MAG: hypothetical protein N2712_07965, partial [Brevinematales bacterium]|nr:hypothetical protein [Brevinematales bacterium]